MRQQGGGGEGEREQQTISLFFIWARNEYAYWTLVDILEMQGPVGKILRENTRKIEILV